MAGLTLRGAAALLAPFGEDRIFDLPARLLGLELGADDYVCKPYSPREVVARVKAVLRRTSGEYEAAELLSLDKDRYAALLNGKELDLTAIEFRLLEMLTSRPGVIFSRDQLMENI